MSTVLAPETAWLWLSVACYTIAGAGSLRQHAQAVQRWLALLLLAGVLAVALAIAERWLRTGQGPFLTLYEVLLSNLFSLGLAYGLAYLWLPVLRPSAVVAVPLLLLLGVWALTASPAVVPLPATFEHPWLWLHVLSGKLFLGACLIAVSVCGLLLLRQRRGTSESALVEAATELDAWVWRFMALAFVCQSFMLIAGAVWAHDAWGRYWAWDPLETWAFATWLALGAVLHARLTFRLPLWLGWLLVIGVFVLAFLTFFGVPFLSLAPHKGVM